MITSSLHRQFNYIPSDISHSKSTWQVWQKPPRINGISLDNKKEENNQFNHLVLIKWRVGTITSYQQHIIYRMLIKSNKHVPSWTHWPSKGSRTPWAVIFSGKWNRWPANILLHTQIPSLWKKGRRPIFLWKFPILLDALINKCHPKFINLFTNCRYHMACLAIVVILCKQKKSKWFPTVKWVKCKILRQNITKRHQIFQSILITFS